MPFGDVDQPGATGRPWRIREGHAFVETVFQSQPTAGSRVDPVGNFHPAWRWAQSVCLRNARDLEASRFYAPLQGPLQNAFAGRTTGANELVVSKASRVVPGCHIVARGLRNDRNWPVRCGSQMGPTKEDFDRFAQCTPNYVKELVTMKIPMAQCINCA